MRANRFRELLDAGQPTLGTHLLSAWPTLVELVGQAGQFDYVEFTAEYAPFDLHELDNLGRALELAGLAGMLKVEQAQRMHQTMRAIGDPEAAVRYQAMGVGHFCLGWDVGILHDWWQVNGARLRERLGTKET